MKRVNTEPWFVSTQTADIKLEILDEPETVASVTFGILVAALLSFLLPASLFVAAWALGKLVSGLQ